MSHPIFGTKFFIYLICLTGFRVVQTAVPFVNVNQLLGQAQATLTCDDLGFPGAILSQCGYCVEGNTGLPSTYGQDCAGICSGSAYVDCAGNCNGPAYIDECSGQCVMRSSFSVDSYPLSTTSSNKNVTNGTAVTRPRDCTGFCNLTSDNPEDLIVFVKDACGICVAQSTLLADIVEVNASTPNVTSKYKDCAGVCYSPAKASMMAAVINNDTCFECIGPNTKATLGDFLDGCGQCRNLNLPCVCPNDVVDMCGVCGGRNNSCTTIISATPSIIPSASTTTINIHGVALQSKYHTICLFIKENLGETGQDEYKFPAHVLDTISCDVTLDEGVYQLHLAIEENQNVKILSNTSVLFTVYSKLANIQPRFLPSMVMLENESNFTVSFLTQNLQRLDHIFCNLSGEAFDLPVQVNSSAIVSEQVNCTFPYPKFSSVVNISVSLDNQTPFRAPFSIQLIAPMPRITNAYILAEGDSIVIIFNHNIEFVQNFSTCEDVLTPETTKVLGDGATCVWATKRQLIVTLGNTSSYVGNNQSASNGVIILYFRDNLLKKENETYAELIKDLSADFALSEEVPVAILIGPNTVPPCGKFLLDGHQSIGIQRRRVNFQWRVSTPSGNVTSSNESLNILLQDATNRNEAALLVDSEMLAIGVPYTFTLIVSNGITASGNRSSSSNHTVVRQYNNIPAMMIEASLAHYPDMISANKRFTLHTYLAMPTCQYELFAISYRWSVSNPKVKFDTTQIAKDSYTVEPYALPAGENVTFTVTVTLNNDPNMTSNASITIKVKSSEIKMSLPGGYQRTVGNESGMLVFNVSQSYFVDMPSLPLVFRWSCVTAEDSNPCYNYDPSVNDILLLNKPVIQSSNLTIPTSKLKPGSVLNFFVQSFSPLNSSNISDTRNVVIKVSLGQSPMLTIDSISAVGSDSEGPEFEDTVYLIPAMADVLVTATVLHSAPLRSLEWFIPGFIEDVEAFSINQSLQTNHTSVTLRIPREHVVANGIYEVNLTAIDNQDRSGWVVSSFMILSPVTGCVVKVTGYQAFTMISIVVESCSAAAYSYPLSYQVYFYYKFSLVSLSPVEYHLPIEVMGPPYLSDNSTESNSDNKAENIFAVRVCNIMNSCWMFNSSAVTVTPASDLQAAAEHVFLMANLAKHKGDYLGCLRRRALYLFSMKPEARVKFEMEFESQMADSLLCARKASSDQCNDTACFANLFTLMMAIPIETNPSRDFVLVEIIEKALDRIDQGNITLTVAGAQDALLLLESIYNYNTSDVVVAQKVATLEILVEKILARSLYPGESTLLLDSTGHPWIAMTFSLLNEAFDVGIQQNSNRSAGLSLGQSSKSRFSNWKCQGENGSICKGVVAEMQFFPSYVYRPINVDVNNTVSEIVGINLWNPITGEKLSEQVPFTLKLTAKPEILQSNLTYNCYYWDDENKQWSSSGIETSVKNQSVFFCESDVLAIYAVIGTVPTLSPGEIAAIVIGVLVGLAIIAAIVFLAYKKTRTKTMRVSMSKGYHPNVQ